MLPQRTCVLAVTAPWSVRAYAAARETHGRGCVLLVTCYLLPQRTSSQTTPPLPIVVRFAEPAGDQVSLAPSRKHFVLCRRIVDHESAAGGHHLPWCCALATVEEAQRTSVVCAPVFRREVDEELTRTGPVGPNTRS